MLAVMTRRGLDDANALLQLRLANQYLQTPSSESPRHVVAHLGAVQSQDYPAALWALKLRLQGATRPGLEAAFERGEILRTHVLRPTWHFVAPEDIRWMLALTGPRIIRGMASRERDLGLDEALAARSAEVIGRALEGGRALTRTEIGNALRAAGVDIGGDPGLLSHLISRCELAALVCSGPMQGKNHTWVLLDQRAPGPRRDLRGDEAVAELVCRYFTSHGPATLSDFAWWSGLTMGDARRGLAAFGSRFASTTVDDKTYWYSSETADRVGAGDAGRTWLLPNYDEYTVAYRQREIFYPLEVVYRPGPRDDVPFGNVIMIDGRVVGLWKRRVPRDPRTLEPRWFNAPTSAEEQGFAAAAAEYAAYFGDSAVA